MKLLEELEKLRRQHYYCEDCWFSCPKAEDGCCDESVGEECNCDAERKNAILDGIIEHLKKVVIKAEEVEPVVKIWIDDIGTQVDIGEESRTAVTLPVNATTLSFLV